MHVLEPKKTNQIETAANLEYVSVCLNNETLAYKDLSNGSRLTKGLEHEVEEVGDDKNSRHLHGH